MNFLDHNLNATAISTTLLYISYGSVTLAFIFGFLFGTLCGASFPDGDRYIWKHRKTLHNVFVLLVVFIITYVLYGLTQEDTMLGLTLGWGVSFLSHIFLDLWTESGVYVMYIPILGLSIGDKWRFLPIARNEFPRRVITAITILITGGEVFLILLLAGKISLPSWGG